MLVRRLRPTLARFVHEFYEPAADLRYFFNRLLRRNSAILQIWKPGQHSEFRQKLGDDVDDRLDVLFELRDSFGNPRPISHANDLLTFWRDELEDLKRRPLRRRQA